MMKTAVPCGTIAALPAHAAETPPNIILIFSDDMGYADIGPFGNTELRTPHLNKMAEEGMKFTSYYATPVCSMSRASLMTGCYNLRVSIPGGLFPPDKIDLNPEEITLAEIVKPKGYATAALYNLTDDPGESKDVASEHPDIVERLTAEAGKREAEIQEHQRPPGRINPV